MALRDQPYLPLYVQDFLTDEKLIECSASATGVYIRIMCIMHKSEPYGVVLLKQKDKQTDNQIQNFALKLLRSLPYDLNTIISGLNELISEGVLQLENDELHQKRMIKDFAISKVRKEAGKKGGEKTQFAKANIEANAENETGTITETIIVDKPNYRLIFEKVLRVNNIELPQEFFDLILEWLKYKSEKGQTYKETGLKAFIVKAMTDCNGSAKTLKNMILYSTSNNYSGLFKDTSNGTKNSKRNSGATNEELAGYFANKYGTDSPQ